MTHRFEAQIELLAGQDGLPAVLDTVLWRVSCRQPFLSSFGWRSISRSGSPSGMISHNQPYRDDGSAGNRQFILF
jgi:hypothetical protein